MDGATLPASDAFHGQCDRLAKPFFPLRRQKTGDAVLPPLVPVNVAFAWRDVIGPHLGQYQKLFHFHRQLLSKVRT